MWISSNYVPAKFRFIRNIIHTSVNQVEKKHPFLTIVRRCWEKPHEAPLGKSRMSSQKKKLKLQIDVDEASEYENSLAVRFWWV